MVMVAIIVTRSFSPRQPPPFPSTHPHGHTCTGRQLQPNQPTPRRRTHSRTPVNVHRRVSGTNGMSPTLPLRPRLPTPPPPSGGSALFSGGGNGGGGGVDGPSAAAAGAAAAPEVLLLLLLPLPRPLSGPFSPWSWRSCCRRPSPSSVGGEGAIPDSAAAVRTGWGQGGECHPQSRFMPAREVPMHLASIDGPTNDTHNRGTHTHHSPA